MPRLRPVATPHRRRGGDDRRGLRHGDATHHSKRRGAGQQKPCHFASSNRRRAEHSRPHHAINPATSRLDAGRMLHIPLNCCRTRNLLLLSSPDVVPARRTQARKQGENPLASQRARACGHQCVTVRRGSRHPRRSVAERTRQRGGDRRHEGDDEHADQQQAEKPDNGLTVSSSFTLPIRQAPSKPRPIGGANSPMPIEITSTMPNCSGSMPTCTATGHQQRAEQDQRRGALQHRTHHDQDGDRHQQETCRCRRCATGRS